MDRRAFLQQMGVWGVGFGALSQSACQRPLQLLKDDAHAPRVAVVGAGLAGLTCAYALSNAGMRVTVYEGSGRLGGRISTAKNLVVDDSWCDLGGEFVDSSHRELIALLKAFRIPLLDTFKDSEAQREIFVVDGQQFRSEKALIEFQRISPRLIADAKSCGSDYDTPQAKQFDTQSLEHYVAGLPCEAWFKKLLLLAYTGEFGLPAQEQSSLNLISMLSEASLKQFQIFGASDERYKIQGGSQSVVDALSKSLGDRVVVAHALAALRQSHQGYELHFSNGKAATADVVVLTLPFTRLRTVSLELKELTPEKRECIQSLRYGQNNKLLLGFEERVWRTGGSGVGAGYAFSDAFEMGWDHTHMQRGNRGSGGYTLYFSAENAKQLEKLSATAKARLPKYLETLNQVYPGAAKAYAAKYSTALWTKNPWVQGSYSAYGVGDWTRLAGLEAQPVGQVYFAGEHCSEMFQGYMNGAVSTALAVAKSISKKRISL